MVIVGAGYIGLEAAASCRHLGLEVTVLEMADRPLNRVTTPEMSAFYLRRHEREGVRILCGMSVTSFVGNDAGHVRAVACGEREFEADFVIVGVGILPETTLAAAAGLRCENGIWVDEQCQTSDPNIYAAGDCTYHPGIRYERRMRLESVDNAVEQAKTAAMNICGKHARHEHVPWFWSDQYDLKLQIAGLVPGLRPDRRPRRSGLGQVRALLLCTGQIAGRRRDQQPEGLHAGQEVDRRAEAPRPGAAGRHQRGLEDALVR